MLFNSFAFLLYLPIVFLIYWRLSKNLKLQNTFIVIASYIFYGWWDWRFLFLIAITTLFSFLSGILISKWNDNRLKKRSVLTINILLNLGILGL